MRGVVTPWLCATTDSSTIDSANVIFEKDSFGIVSIFKINNQLTIKCTTKPLIGVDIILKRLL